MLRIVRYDRLVRLESASCPLDPLILSTVTQFRPILLYDSVFIFTKVAILCGMGLTFSKKTVIWCGTGDIYSHQSHTI